MSPKKGQPPINRILNKHLEGYVNVTNVSPSLVVFTSVSLSFEDWESDAL